MPIPKGINPLRFVDSCMCGAEDCPFCHPENVPDLERVEDITEEEEDPFHD